ncbi:unnamed protein product, partial [Discosporangium mesarthrocarpum]
TGGLLRCDGGIARCGRTGESPRTPLPSGIWAPRIHLDAWEREPDCSGPSGFPLGLLDVLDSLCFDGYTPAAAALPSPGNPPTPAPTNVVDNTAPMDTAEAEAEAGSGGAGAADDGGNGRSTWLPEVSAGGFNMITDHFSGIDNGGGGSRDEQGGGGGVWAGANTNPNPDHNHNHNHNHNHDPTRREDGVGEGRGEEEGAEASGRGPPPVGVSETEGATLGGGRKGPLGADAGADPPGGSRVVVYVRDGLIL